MSDKTKEIEPREDKQDIILAKERLKNLETVSESEVDAYFNERLNKKS